MIEDLQSFIQILKKEGELVEIQVSVDPYLEAAEIHRRVIDQEGPALLFRHIKGADFPLVTNLFGNRRRIELAFGPRPEQVITQIAKLPEELLPPSIKKLWHKRNLLFDLSKIGLKNYANGKVTEVRESVPNLLKLPLLTTWQKDGGAFITLPLVLTQHPLTKISNLGMYRMQRFDQLSTGLHCQIGKGGGFHLAAAREVNQNLPVNVFVGGPPALILSAIAPLPENVPELLLASLALGKKLPIIHNSESELPLVANAEFAFVGQVNPTELRAEGPFGDHYGYYSLQHDYPVFHCKKVFRRKNPIFTATVVGKPKQEDFFLGDYLQQLLSPLFPLVMPAVKDIWSYGETGYHSLAAAVVKERYKREAMMSGFRILGEGQLSLTKFLIITDQNIDLRDFKKTLEFALERSDFRSDLFVFSNVAMDTLDYTGPKVNEGSKGLLLALGSAWRTLPAEYHGTTPLGISKIAPFCKGCLVVSGLAHQEEPMLGEIVLKHKEFSEWPLIVLVDDAEATVKTPSKFLWTTFTRFEPGADIKSIDKEIVRNHISYGQRILIDARMKANYPAELFCDDKTANLVSTRWKEYGIS